MPTYEYQCIECSFEFETIHGFKDEDYLKICPECQTENLRLIYSAPDLFVKGDPKTLGLLAERNRQSMSQSEYAEKIRSDKESYKAAIKQRKESRPLVNGENRPELFTGPTPWRPNKAMPDLSLASMTPKKAEKYIMEGIK